MAENPKHRYVAIDQLCVGLFIHLDLSWLDHNFSRSSFKIKSKEQIAAIRRLGLTRVRIDPERSDCAPQPALADDAPAAAVAATVAAPSAEETAAVLAKRARIDRINLQRAAVIDCEKKFLHAGATLKNIGSNIFSRPQEACQRANELVDQMVDSILTDRDIAIYLMNDKVGAEEMYFHSLNVAVLAMMVGKELGLPPDDIRNLGLGSLFHDIGKVDIPDRVLQKTTPLTRAEQNLVQQHCQLGLTIAQKMALPQAARDIIMQHHECMNGSGYPRQLKDENISPLARIVAIVNAYDNLCNPPNPAEAYIPAAALSRLFVHQRAHFDIGPLTVFIRCLGVYPPGTLVRLSDDTLGLVLAVNASTPLRPSVLIYDAEIPKNEAIILDLQNEPEITISASLKPSQLTREVHEYLAPRKRMTYYFDVPKKDGAARA